MIPPWIQTRGGHAIDLVPPDPTTLVFGDLAYAVAHLNRYTGHAGVYPVAQHLVLGARALRDEGHASGVQRAYLLHDLHEGICGDLSSPGKRAVRAYHRRVLAEAAAYFHRGAPGADLDRMEAAIPDPWTRYEGGCARAVRLRFAGPLTMPGAVKIADIRMLLTEKRDLFAEPTHGRDWRDTIPEEFRLLAPYEFRIVPWAPLRAEWELRDEAARLGVR